MQQERMRQIMLNKIRRNEGLGYGDAFIHESDFGGMNARGDGYDSYDCYDGGAMTPEQRNAYFQALADLQYKPLKEVVKREGATLKQLKAEQSKLNKEARLKYLYNKRGVPLTDEQLLGLLARPKPLRKARVLTQQQKDNRIAKFKAIRVKKVEANKKLVKEINEIDQIIKELRGSGYDY